MGKSKRLTASHYISLLKLQGEVAELAVTDRTAALNHLLDGVNRLLKGATTWLSVLRRRTEGPDESGKGGGWDVCATHLHGLEQSQYRAWEQWFLLDEEYRSHPMMVAGAEGAGRARTHLREELVRDEEWYSSPHVMEWLRPMGFDATLGSALPLAEDLELYLVGTRVWGDRNFDGRERQMLGLLHQHLAWFYRLMLKGSAASPDHAANLPPRLRRLLDSLLAGSSEKEAARELGLSPRTVHKYVEQLYRALGVASRAELMALWVRRDVKN